MSALRTAALFAALIALACAAPAFAQSAPGAGGGGYDVNSMTTSSPAVRPATLSSTSTTVAMTPLWAGVFAFRVALSAGGWWTAPAVVALPVVTAPSAQATTVRRTSIRR